MTRKSYAKRFARKIAKRDGKKCHYCGHPLQSKYFGDDIPHYHPDNACIDHLQPKSRGGTNSLNNLVLACRSCNGRKGTKTAEEFNQYLTLINSLDSIEQQYADDWRVLELVRYFKSGRLGCESEGQS